MNRFHFKKSFTLVELVIVIILLSVLAGAGLGALLHFSGIFLVSPEENLSLILHNATKKLVEGDYPGCRLGLRYAAELDTIEEERLVFTNQDSKRVELKIEEGSLKRSLEQGPFEIISAGSGQGIVISGKEGIFFRYLDREGGFTENPEQVKIVNINFKIQKHQKKITTATAVAIKPF